MTRYRFSGSALDAVEVPSRPPGDPSSTLRAAQLFLAGSRTPDYRSRAFPDGRRAHRGLTCANMLAMTMHTAGWTSTAEGTSGDLFRATCSCGWVGQALFGNQATAERSAADHADILNQHRPDPFHRT